MRVVRANTVEKALAPFASCGVYGVPKAVIVETVHWQRIFRRPGTASVTHLKEADIGVGDNILRQNVVVAPVRRVDEEQVRRIAFLCRKMPNLISCFADNFGDGRIGQYFNQPRLRRARYERIKSDIIHVDIAGGVGRWSDPRCHLAAWHE